MMTEEKFDEKAIQIVRKEYTSAMRLQVADALLQIDSTTLDDDTKLQLKQWVLSVAPSMVHGLMRTGLLKIPASMIILNYSVIKNEIGDIFNESFIEPLRKRYAVTEDDVFNEHTEIVRYTRDYALGIVNNLAWDIVVHLPMHVNASMLPPNRLFNEGITIRITEIELAAHIGLDAQYVIVFEEESTPLPVEEEGVPIVAGVPA
jgi:hypothetical protein